MNLYLHVLQGDTPLTSADMYFTEGLFNRF